MANFTLTLVDRFPNGTTVKAYAAANWPTPAEPSGTPQGAATAEATMTSGTLTFTGLTKGTRYWAAAEVGGAYRYVKFVAGEDTAAVNEQFMAQADEEVASANTIAPSAKATLIRVTGTTEIKKITATAAGHLIALKFAGSLTVKNGENLKLGADLSATENDVVLLVCDGTNWYRAAAIAAN